MARGLGSGHACMSLIVLFWGHCPFKSHRACNTCLKTSCPRHVLVPMSPRVLAEIQATCSLMLIRELLRDFLCYSPRG